MLNRAFELRQDQEEEIKHCNSLILGTKCLVIRRAQIAEKELIQCVLLSMIFNLVSIIPRTKHFYILNN